MSGIHTQWSVRDDHRVEPDDLDPDGRVGHRAADRWATQALVTYLEQCETLDRARTSAGLDLTRRRASGPEVMGLAPAPIVLVTATATEVFPTSFVVAVRVRPVGGDDDHPLDLSYSIQLEDPTTGDAQPLGTEVRDELIALALSARHYN
jgi:hypothetical protein